MPPTTKDIDIASSGSPTTAAASADNSGKPQPVALEVPVTVNGARTVEGSDKREPFSESTNTVLVFGHGAVIRLASAVAPGQLLFLTNDKTKKEVVCQVVKSKNYRNVSGYVELEFTETIAGFWGMRFPGERPAAPTVAPASPAIKSPAPVATTPRSPAPVTTVPPVAPPPVVPKVEAPAISSLPKRPEPQSQPLSTAAALSDSLAQPTASPLKTETKLPQVVDPRSGTTLPKGPASGDPFASSLPSSWLAPESKPSGSATRTPASTPIDETPSLEELKRESARLQEQFASMLLGVDTASKSAPTPPTSSAPSKSIADSAAKGIEMAKVQPPAVLPTPPAKNASSTTPSSLDTEEVKIPSWLEPLARNVATPSHNEIPAREEAPKVDRAVEFEVQDLSSPSTPQETAPAAHEEPISDMESLRELIAADRVPSEKSNKGIVIGAIAAGLVVMAAGATWYIRQSPTAAPSNTAVASSAPVSAPVAVQAPAKKTVEPSTASATNPGTSAPISPSPNPAGLRSQSLSPAEEPLKAAVDKNAAAELFAYKKLAEPQPQPVQPQPTQPKKPILGEVHLAAPAVNRPATSAAGTPDAEPAPILSASAVSSTDSLGGGLATSGAAQPAAPAVPLPVGGDVKQARLISTVQPIYPMLAKNQHAEGNVQIDALIDANGRVSTMKVVSGPILLRQSAMDALKQWKYQPATLDGKPVATHLTVTLQFHLQ
jgi:periplasmic protein TonB